MNEKLGVEALSHTQLRWYLDPQIFSFESTRDVQPIQGIVGQDSAVESLQFGLHTTAPGQNIFVRGLDGTGRMALIERLLSEDKPKCRRTLDHCYVTNFDQSDRPTLLTFESGKGAKFRKKMDRFADYVRDELASALDSEAINGKRKKLLLSFQDQIKQLIEPFEKALAEADLKLVSVQVGNATKNTLFPIHLGEPVSPDDYEKLKREGRISEKKFNEFIERREAFASQFEELTLRIQELHRDQADAVLDLMSAETRRLLDRLTRPIRKEFKQPGVDIFLDQVTTDIESKLPVLAELGDFTRYYRVNVVSSRDTGQGCPIIVENTPTVSRLLGTIDQVFDPQGGSRSDHLMIRAGSLLRADGGYLILDALDLLEAPGAWSALVRTLRTERLEIVPQDSQSPYQPMTLKPDPIGIDVKVILIGDAGIYYMLEANARDFGNLFKVLADFDSHIPRNSDSACQYASVLARMVVEENLTHFSREAVAALVEHGARIAARDGKLSARFGRLADIARESAYLAQQEKSDLVADRHVHETVKRTKRRANLPSRRFSELIGNGTIRILTQGHEVGQVNGLAVMSAGPLTYGFPTRITATIGPGTAGVINIEREASLSGAIHTKGFYILGGLMRELLKTEHPLTFEASIAFEQSYGGIDGDSASGAEVCCLLSSLTELPMRQDLAMTGAIDQKGNVLAIGAVNEKIEGFFDVCQASGLTGSQGVIIPAANAGDLMLRQDLVDKAAKGEFHIYPVSRIEQALELFLEHPAGGQTDPYPADSILGIAITRSRAFWDLVAAGPSA